MHLSLGRQNTPQARVRETCWFPLVMNNRSRFFPAFGVCAELTLELMGKKITAWGEPILSLPAQHQKEMMVEFSPTHRGKVALSEATVATQYPFGFFEKSRTEPLNAGAFCVFPERMDVRQWVTRLIRAMGENPAAQRGMGDEFFSLKNFEEGDDPRKIAWRRSAKVGRFFVKETPLHARGKERKWNSSLNAQRDQ